MNRNSSELDEAAGEWAFYWAPPWKGAAWLALYLAVSFLHRFLFLRLLSERMQELGAWRLLVMLTLNPVIWVSALLCWLSMRGKEWRCIGGDANSRRVAFLKTYVPEAASLMALMFITWLVSTLTTFFSAGGWGRMARMGIISWRFFMSFPIGSLNNAAIAGISIPMFTYLAVTRLPNKGKGLAGVILPGLLTNLMFCSMSYNLWHWVTPLRIRLGIAANYEYFLALLLQQLAALTLIGGLGCFAVKHVNVRVFRSRE